LRKDCEAGGGRLYQNPKSQKNTSNTKKGQQPIKNRKNTKNET